MTKIDKSATKIDKSAFTDTRTVCKIWDTETNKFYVTPKGKSEWRLRNHAANAVNANPPPWMVKKNRGFYNDWFKFSGQTRLIVVRATYTITDIEIL